MKAQAINIDFTIALALFLFTAAGSIAAVQAQRGDANTPGRSSQIADRIETEASTTAFQRKLVMSSPTEIPSYPVDMDLEFAEAAEPGSASFEGPADVNISTGNFVSVPDMRNRSLRLSYLALNSADSTSQHNNDIVARDGTNLRNSEIRLPLGGPGLDGLVDRDLGRDLVRSQGNVSLQGNDFSTREQELSASSLSGNLKIYNGSPEFVVAEGPARFYLKDLPKLYVLKGNETFDLGPGFDREFSTRALAVTESPSSSRTGGLVLGGNLSVNVTTVASGVDLEVSFEDRLRVRMVDGLSEGFRRALVEKGHAKFGPVERFAAAHENKISELASLDDDAFRSRLAIGSDLGYNVSLGSLKSVGEPVWRGDFDGTNRTSDGPEADLVLNTTDDQASYTRSYTIDSAAVTRAVVSGVDRPEGVLLTFGIDTPSTSEDVKTVENGSQVFRFDTGSVNSFDASFESSRDQGSEGNWTVGSYQVFYGNALERGATLPPRGDIDTETQVLPSADTDGSITTSVLEVRTWN
jgi:hypothetical protein